MKKVLLVLLIIVTVFVTSCSAGIGGGSAVTYRDNEIDKQTADSVKALDDKVLEDIKSNDSDKILEFSGDSIKKDSAKFKELVKNINEKVKDKSFEYEVRYYCKVNKVGKYTFTVGTSEDDPYYIKIDAPGKDVFISLIKSNSNLDDYLLSLIYTKEQGKWKLCTFYVGEYSCSGMGVNNLYQKAEQLEDKGYTIPAGLYLSLTNQLLNPAPFIEYKKASEINSYSKKVLSNLNNKYTFPKKLESVKNIEVYSLDIQYVKQGLIPVIKYTTSTNLSDENKIRQEANDMNNEVISLYPGMKENFKYFLYEAYSEPPIDSKKMYNCYRTVVEQK